MSPGHTPRRPWSVQGPHARITHLHLLWEVVVTECPRPGNICSESWFTLSITWLITKSVVLEPDLSSGRWAFARPGEHSGSKSMHITLSCLTSTLILSRQNIMKIWSSSTVNYQLEDWIYSWCLHAHDIKHFTIQMHITLSCLTSTLILSRQDIMKIRSSSTVNYHLEDWI